MANVIEVFGPSGCLFVLDWFWKTKERAFNGSGLVLNENDCAVCPSFIKTDAIDGCEEVESIRRSAELRNGSLFLEVNRGGNAWDITFPEFKQRPEKSFGVGGIVGIKQI